MKILKDLDIKHFKVSRNYQTPTTYKMLAMNGQLKNPWKRCLKDFAFDQHAIFFQPCRWVIVQNNHCIHGNLIHGRNKCLIFIILTFCLLSGLTSSNVVQDLPPNHILVNSHIYPMFQFYRFVVCSIIRGQIAAKSRQTASSQTVWCPTWKLITEIDQFWSSMGPTLEVVDFYWLKIVILTEKIQAPALSNSVPS